jgi:hypothetical protein
MKEVVFKYYIKGKEVSLESIDLESSFGIDVQGNNVHILFEDDAQQYRSKTNFNNCGEVRESHTGVINGIGGGVKHNKHKTPLSLIFTQFPKALEAISKCSEYGHNKYKETDKDFLNFKRVEGGSRVYADAGLRHRLETGTDFESGLPHQYHVAWNALSELQLWIEENE